jgi:serpin B
VNLIRSFAVIRLPIGPWLRMAAAVGCALTSLSLASPVRSQTASPGDVPAVAKRIVLDAAVTAPGLPWIDTAAAVTLADLGLALLRGAGGAGPTAPPNEVLSPFSLGTVLTLLHQGSAGATANELAALVDSSLARGHFHQRLLPSLLATLARSEATAGLSLASRIWVRADVLGAVPSAFMTEATGRVGADLALFPPGPAEASRRTINAWAAERTRGAIAQPLAPGSITPTTRIALVSAVHFRSAWEHPFDPRMTADRSFATPAGHRLVPTMIGEMPVRRAALDRLEIIEIPFKGSSFSLLLAMPEMTEGLAAAERRLAGVDLMSWSGRLPPATTCRLHLPRFALAASPRSIKPALVTLGVQTVFGAGADLGPMLGTAAAGTYVEDLIQAVSFAIDETGGEAGAAVAATVQAKSFPAPVPDCEVNRPFLFALVHAASTTPIFVGRISDPATGPVAR